MDNDNLLQAISDMMDKKLEPIQEDIKSLKEDNLSIKEDIKSLKEDNLAIKEDIKSLKEDNLAIKEDIKSLRKEQAQMRSDLELQIKRTERSLKAALVESENLILEEVSRVHNFLNAHIEDKSVHTA